MVLEVGERIHPVNVPESRLAGSNTVPVLEVLEAKTSVVMKRSMASGYAGVDNPLFYKDNNRMLFGDAKKMLDEVLAALKGRSPVGLRARRDLGLFRHEPSCRASVAARRREPGPAPLRGRVARGALVSRPRSIASIRPVLAPPGCVAPARRHFR